MPSAQGPPKDPAQTSLLLMCEHSKLPVSTEQRGCCLGAVSWWPLFNSLCLFHDFGYFLKPGGDLGISASIFLF